MKSIALVGLVGDAVLGISDCFKNLTQLSEEQQTMISALIQQSQSIGDDEVRAWHRLFMSLIKP